MKKVLLIISFLRATISFTQPHDSKNARPLPIIDMHLHCLSVNEFALVPQELPAPVKNFDSWDPKDSAIAYFRRISSANPVRAAKTDDELIRRTVAILEKYNIYAAANGDDTTIIQKWLNASPKRIIPGMANVFHPPSQTEELIQSGKMKFLGELGLQYFGLTLSDSAMDPFLQIAEKYDIPVAVHVGPGPPGGPYYFAPKYRAKLSSALYVEEALLRHPKLRVWIMHAGWPMIDDMINVLYTYPQVYVDLGVICVILPKKEFYHYLQRLVDAGFEKRIMFGSDEIIYPDAIVKGIETIQQTSFLSASQKRDILFNNAARFLRLTPEQIKSMY
jgi:uncharacterized protein